jgi:hypothetical protein
MPKKPEAILLTQQDRKRPEEILLGAFFVSGGVTASEA